MRNILLIATIFLTTASYAKDDKKVERTPANALTIDLNGQFISPSHDNASIELEGTNLKTHLMSRFSNRHGKPVPLSVKATCESENKCILELSQ